MKPPRYWR